MTSVPQLPCIMLLPSEKPLSKVIAGLPHLEKVDQAHQPTAGFWPGVAARAGQGSHRSRSLTSGLLYESSPPLVCVGGVRIRVPVSYPQCA